MRLLSLRSRSVLDIRAVLGGEEGRYRFRSFCVLQQGDLDADCAPAEGGDDGVISFKSINHLVVLVKSSGLRTFVRLFDVGFGGNIAHDHFHASVSPTV